MPVDRPDPADDPDEPSHLAKPTIPGTRRRPASASRPGRSRTVHRANRAQVEQITPPTRRARVVTPPARPPVRTPIAAPGPRRSRRCEPPGNSTRTGIQNESGLPPSTHTDGSWSSGETRRLTPEQNTEATKACADIHDEGERVVLPAMRQIEAADPNRRLAGLEHMLKGEDRLKEKIADALRGRPGLTASKRSASFRTQCDSPLRTAPIVTLMGYSRTLSASRRSDSRKSSSRTSGQMNSTKGSTANGAAQRLACASRCSSTRQRAWRPRN